MNFFLAITVRRTYLKKVYKLPKDYKGSLQKRTVMISCHWGYLIVEISGKSVPHYHSEDKLFFWSDVLARKWQSKGIYEKS